MDAKWNGDITDGRSKAYFVKVLTELRAANPDKEIYLVPVGDVIYKVYQDIIAGKAPILKTKNDLFEDEYHVSKYGKYLVSLVHFATIYKENPTGSTRQNLSFWSGNYEVEQSFAEYAWEVVWNIVTENPYTGVGNSTVKELLTNNTNVIVPEGTSANVGFKLSSKPTSIVTVSFLKTGDSDLTLDKIFLTFTPDNWNVFQYISITAAEDADKENGEITITVTALEYPDMILKATESDNDQPATLGRIEAEDGTQVATMGNTTVSNAVYSNGNAIDFGTTGAYLEFTVIVESSGLKELIFGYNNGDLNGRSLRLLVNGNEIDPSFLFPYTDCDWNQCIKTVSTTVNLVQGQNKVRLEEVNANGPQVDYLEVLEGNSNVNTRPIAVMVADPITGAAPLTVTFNASGSYDNDPNDNVYGQFWNFGDGSDESSLINAEHTYTQSGEYTATLVVIDNSFAKSDTVRTTIIVTDVSTSIEHSSRDVTIYPNPVSHEVTINPFGNNYDRIELRNNLGQVVLNRNFNKNELLQLNTSFLTKGIYHLLIYKKETVLVKNLIISN